MKIFLKNPLEQFETSMMKCKLIIINSNVLNFYAVVSIIVLTFMVENAAGWKNFVTNYAENWVEGELKRYLKEDRLEIWPFVITLPYVILTFNWLSYLPHFFVAFSTIVIPSFIATLFLVQAVLTRLAMRRWNYLAMFCPINGEHWLRPFIFIIEVFAYFAKYLSIALRLFANILSGHVILEVLGNGVAMSFFSANYLCFVITFFLSTALFIMELFIAFAQAFLFIVLMCMYSAD